MESRKIGVPALVLVLAWPSDSVSRQKGQEQDRFPPAAVSMTRSAILPGWGEFGLKEVRRARIFTEVEVVLWMGLLQAGQVTRRYDSRLRSFGSLHAGASFTGKDDQFVTDVGNFLSLDAFNETQQRLRQPDRVYRDPGIFGWSWDSDSNRKTYRLFRIRRDTARKISRFMIGAMVLNRILSVIDVAYLHRITSVSSNLKVYPLVDPGTGLTGLGASVEF